jgi:type IV secretion system protein VirD4
MADPNSNFCTDPKGALAAVTARYRREVLGQDVYVVDPFEILGLGTDGFDPLAIVAVSGIHNSIHLLADAMVMPDPEAKEK